MTELSRRQFIAGCGAFCLWAGWGGAAHALLNRYFPKNISIGNHGNAFKGDAPDQLWQWSREAHSYEKLPDKKLVCTICPHYCSLDPGDRGFCRSKVNMDGILYTIVFGNPCSIHIDPIEKSPLFHFMPGTQAFCIAAAGCNFRCLNCHNWEISQKKPEQIRHYSLFPKDVVREAQSAGTAFIAYTYSEPLTFFEYMLDTAQAAKEKGLMNLLISNGYVNYTPLLDLCKVIDAANINLKSFDDKTYQKLNSGRLQPVLNTFKTLHAQNIYFEITTLVVPGYIDDPEMIRSMCKWIVDNLGKNYPLHFLRFFPYYKLNRLPLTPISTLTEFRNIAMDEGIRYVYLSNVPRHEANNTYCHSCGKMIVERQGYNISFYALNDDHCQFCQAQIPGIWGKNKPQSSSSSR